MRPRTGGLALRFAGPSAAVAVQARRPDEDCRRFGAAHGALVARCCGRRTCWCRSTASAMMVRAPRQSGSAAGARADDRQSGRRLRPGAAPVPSRCGGRGWRGWSGATDRHVMTSGATANACAAAGGRCGGRGCAGRRVRARPAPGVILPINGERPKLARGRSQWMPEIEIYTQPWCPFCARAVNLFTRKGVAFREIEAPHGTAQREEFDPAVRRADLGAADLHRRQAYRWQRRSDGAGRQGWARSAVAGGLRHDCHSCDIGPWHSLAGSAKLRHLL